MEIFGIIKCYSSVSWGLDFAIILHGNKFEFKPFQFTHIAVFFVIELADICQSEYVSMPFFFTIKTLKSWIKMLGLVCTQFLYLRNYLILCYLISS